jgi:hypothetical protein
MATTGSTSYRQGASRVISLLERIRVMWYETLAGISVGTIEGEISEERTEDSRIGT